MIISDAFANKFEKALKRVQDNPDPVLQECFRLSKDFLDTMLKEAKGDPLKVALVNKAHGELLMTIIANAVRKGK